MNDDWYKKWEETFKTAMAKSDALPPGLQVGKIFGVPVGDGSAYYEILKINKRTIRLKWRKDLSCDGYMDIILGEGGSVDKYRIEHIIDSDDVMKKMMGNK